MVTVTTMQRVKAFSDLEFGRIAGSALIDCATKEQFAIPAYCLMPDHAHFVATGRTPQSDLKRLVNRWKQATGFAWKKRDRGNLWQQGYWDRLARFDESLAAMIRYVVENPVRAQLVSEPTLYLLTGSTESTVEQICRTLYGEGRH
ncbi:MAG: transposase [Acidobacteriota bacterium]|nr:transposase [Acidobacteriota bacterium]MDP2390755.1 transposase [Acidobacteriota bacterium]